MDIIKFLSDVRDYIHGFLELATIQTPRYHFVVETFSLSYQSTSIKTKVNYTPIGCYRPLLNYMKIRAYQGGSIFKRYLYSTIPGELLFSFTFTFLCFYKETSFEDTMHVFVVSAMVKITLSVLFAVVMSFVVRVSFSKETIKNNPINAQVN
jgi:hypothetical protein